MTASKAGLPLSGVNVLDFTWALVGSLSTKHLGDYGANVIKIESMTRPCVSRFIKQVSVSDRRNPNDKPWFANLNTSKRSFSLDLKHPRARDILRRFVEWADVVTENFSPGTMTRLGLGYEQLRAIKPDIIMASGSVYGQTGPLASLPGIDVTGAALSGRLHLSGWEDRTPVMPAVPYGDTLLPKFIAGGVAVALDYRRRTGRGTHIDASMYEVLVQQLAYEHARADIEGRSPARAANRSTDALIQGVFPCAGEDNWVAITAFDDTDWQALADVLGGEWPGADRVAIMLNEELEALEERIAAATRSHDGARLVSRLRERDIAAGIALDIEDATEDPQMRHRKVLKDLDHPELGTFGHQESPFRLGRTPAAMFRAPGIGEHTEEICREVLGLSDEEIRELKQEKVLA